MAVTVYVEFPIHPEKFEEFAGLLRGALSDTRARQGFIDISVHVDQDKPGRTVLWERWESRSDYEAYLQWRTETGFLDTVGPYLCGEPVFAFFDDVAS